jgi:hypothetical protein
MSCGQWLILIGGLFEFAGAALVIYEIRRDLREARQLEGSKRIRARVASTSAASSAARIDATGGRKPTLEERFLRLEGRVELVEQDIKGMVNQINRLSKNTADQLDQRLTDLESTTNALLAGILSSGFKLRYIGVGAILAGIVLTTWGGLITAN